MNTSQLSESLYGWWVGEGGGGGGSPTVLSTHATCKSVLKKEFDRLIPGKEVITSFSTDAQIFLFHTRNNIS